MSRAQKIVLAVWLIGFLIVFAALYIYITSPKYTSLLRDASTTKYTVTK